MENRGLRSLAAPLFSCIGEKTMLSYTGKRLLQTVFVLFGISPVSYTHLVAALLDLGADQKVLRKVLKSLPIQEFDIRISRVKKAGLDVCDFDARIAFQI